MKDWCDQTQDKIKGTCSICFGTGFISKIDECNISSIPCPQCKKDEVVEKLNVAWNHWDVTWMNLAKDIGMKSTCNVPDRQIGCVIVPEDNTGVIALGYNGTGKGDDNKCVYDGDVVKAGTSRCTCVHAEINAFIKLDILDPRYKIMYITYSPCFVCAQALLNAGINEVVYGKLYDTDTVIYLRNNNVKVREFNEDNGS